APSERTGPAFERLPLDREALARREEQFVRLAARGDRKLFGAMLDHAELDPGRFRASLADVRVVDREALPEWGRLLLEWSEAGIPRLEEGSLRVRWEAVARAVLEHRLEARDALDGGRAGATVREGLGQDWFRI